MTQDDAHNGPAETGPWSRPDTPSASADPRFGADAAPERPDQYPCPQCGADLRYDPEALALSCGHCGHRRAIAPGGAPVAERDYLEAVSGAAARHDVAVSRAARCESCGAATTLEAGIEAEVCPFCAGALTLEPDARRRFTPDGVLPFATPEHAARRALSEWLDRLWFAPGDLGAYAREAKRLSGVYLPFWTFDANATADYRGRRGDAYTERQTRTFYQDGKAVRRTVPVRKIRWRPVSGRVRRAFDDVLTAASRSLPAQFAQKLSGARGGWDLHDLKPYAPEYLAGKRAETYTVDLEAGYAEARGVMELALRRDVRFDIGGDRQRIERFDARYHGVSFKLVLLPIWIAAYRYRGETYRFVVNGRTGEVIGERPYSWSKIALSAVAAITLVVLLGFGALLLDGLL
ncbi:MAG: primosomal protein N' (replication factor Y) - superfamily II helicase [Pseudomonadota bacterium]